MYASINPCACAQSVEWLLNYNYGALRDWRAAAADPTGRTLHMCSQSILSGEENRRAGY